MYHFLGLAEMLTQNKIQFVSGIQVLKVMNQLRGWLAAYQYRANMGVESR